MINDVMLFVVYLIVLILLALPLGKYMFHVFENKKTFLDPLLVPAERLIYRLCGIDAGQEMNWKQYAWALILFHLFSFLAVFFTELLQGILPFNPQHQIGVPWDLAFNTAVSFITNTNWQNYGGETTMSYFTQMAALAVHNFLSAATGLAVAVALIRGLTRKTTADIGNYWVDMVRSVLWVFLPICIVLTLLFVQQGVIQNFSSYVSATTLEGAKQTIAMGPVASQEAIKMLGTNGGGFFNVNSAHPFENPTPLTNFIQVLAIFLIPVALVFTFGHMVRDKRQGYAVLAAMLLLFILFLGTLYSSELFGNPNLAAMGISSPNAMEGKEVRFGIGGSALFSTVTTAASCGAVNSMLDSYTPLGGLVPMLQIMVGEVVVGGVGAGFYGMLVFVILTVFIVGLMVGRTPEYLGKKIESFEMKMAVIAVLVPAVTILTGSAIASVTGAGTSAINNPGPHGLSEIIYAYTSSAGNNGSAFAGLNGNSLFYNLTLGIAMILGRFGVILPVLAIAGSLAEKRISPPGAGTFPTDGWLFVILLAAIVIVVGALTFLPALALGPIVEHLSMLHGQFF
ncbi:potassium-transporting atpase a chain [Lucifera butyrica]|uniref:Potassium-transporting ATPase potassium-binding subunit n=1 Tax=Lucifera butyrica TaxID=1351585 RepID=A0A498R6T7_9FIRM|nr:potassium-transporting ATPase subunit KdpA [Lucifera butyrica]VBB07071.1 potassium-transporting atpase a chain [Lucifera butyrica]